VGDSVLTAVCRQASAWKAAGLGPSSVTFNVSPRQLRRTDLVGILRDKLSADDLEPADFTVEITESAAMEEAPLTEPVLEELSRLGVGLAIDDFGSGHSSLARLRRLPFDVLKIDQAFIRDVPDDAETSAIVSSVIDLARGLGMTAVAEGVETQAQLDFLEARDCPMAQGHHLGPPLPGEEANDLLRRSRG
jgi:EAL domain-containing protein (putative c-di-GMP-specific phosphodiesterase class I)